MRGRGTRRGRDGRKKEGKENECKNLFFLFERRKYIEKKTLKLK